ncbi:MAG: MarR family winged helix-turn-helix transcriptional regulator [Candidatus Dormibacteria bacterium]
MVVSETNQSVHLQAWRALLRAQAGLACSLERELMAAEGLPLAWYEVLLVLDHAPEGALRLQRLMDTVLMTKSGVSRLVDRMETAGLVARSGCPSDRRGAFAVITEQGRAKLRRAMPVHSAGIDRHLASVLNAEEAGRLRDALGAVADALGGEGVFLACTGADGELRPDAETEGLAVLTARAES